MNTIKTIGLTSVAILVLTACGGGGSDTPTATFTEGKVVFSDGTTLGVTKAEAQENGGFNIYDIGTGEVVGFIALDGSVNGVDGSSYGVCEGVTITENGVNGECKVPTTNPSSPNNTIEEPATNTGGDTVFNPNAGADETLVIVDESTTTSTGTLNGGPGGTLTQVP